MIPPSTCQPWQTDRSGPMPETTVTTPSYTTPWDTIMPNRHVAAAQLFRDPLDARPQPLQAQQRRDLVRRLHHLPPRQIPPRKRLHRFFHPALLVSEGVQFLLSPGVQFYLSPDIVRLVTGSTPEVRIASAPPVAPNETLSQSLPTRLVT